MARRTKRKVAFNEMLAESIQSSGLSQSEVARRLGVKQQAVSKWVQGKSKPRPGHVAELARVLAVDFTHLREAAGYTADDLRSDTWRFAYEQGYADATAGREPTVDHPDGPVGQMDQPRTTTTSIDDMLERLGALEDAVKRHGEMLDAVLEQLPTPAADEQPLPSSRRSAPSTFRRS